MKTSKDQLAQSLLKGLHDVLGTPEGFMPLHEPAFSKKEETLVLDCLNSTFVSSVGEYVDQFEKLLADYTGAKHAIAVVNGTSALHVALKLAGVEADDEVLVPALTFVATANAVSYCDATPHLVDVNLNTMGLDPDTLDRYLAEITESTPKGTINKKTGRRISAIIPMHTYGHPVDIGRLTEVANQYNLPVVEDAAESLGSTYQEQHTGTFGLLGTLSFNGNKIITTGGGGAVLTNDDELAARAKHLTTTAKQPHSWAYSHDEVGWNYRMPNLNAALGCAQMESLPGFLARKRELASKYQVAFKGVQGLRFMDEPAGTRSNYWLNTVLLEKPDAETRDHLLASANDGGFQCRPTWTLLHKQPMYSSCPRSALPVAEQIEASLINLPSSPKLIGR